MSPTSSPRRQARHTILAVSGSLREGSNSGELLRAAQELSPGGWDVRSYEGLAEVPAYSEDIDGDEMAPAAVKRWRAAIERADALLIVSPEYNGSAPGALKNALDWASRPHGASALAGRPAAVITSSPSPFGGTWAGEALRRVLTISGAAVLEAELAIGRVTDRLSGGRLTDAGTREEIASMLSDLIELADASEQVQPLAA